MTGGSWPDPEVSVFKKPRKSEIVSFVVLIPGFAVFSHQQMVQTALRLRKYLTQFEVIVQAQSWSEGSNHVALVCTWSI
jgi:hypothetical protein